MARTTDPSLRNLCIYSIFIRNHSASGDFAGIIADLDRIASLGIDVIWLLPIHPIGRMHRKGTLGSPYAISDYRSINPQYGTIDDFRALLTAAHRKGLKVIIDVVFNHTSPDSLLRSIHPEWFWRDAAGNMGNRVGEWTDVIDLDYGNPGLWDYQIETLKGWLREGVDGFRCDVASLLPLSFWMEARDACGTLNPDTLWLAETVEEDFITTIRRAGYSCLNDSEALRVFDLSYEYDVYPVWKEYTDGLLSLDSFIKRLRIQEAALNETDCKLRFLENHDQDRAAYVLKTDNTLKQWTAYSLFAKGAALIYAGGEYGIEHRPDLFEPDPVDWSFGESDEARAHESLLKQLIQVKKDGIVRDGFYWLPEAPEDTLLAAYERRSPQGSLTGLRLGIFHFGKEATSEIDLLSTWPELGPHPVLKDLVSEKPSKLSGGCLRTSGDFTIVDWGITI